MAAADAWLRMLLMLLNLPMAALAGGELPMVIPTDVEHCDLETPMVHPWYPMVAVFVTITSHQWSLNVP